MKVKATFRVPGEVVSFNGAVPSTGAAVDSEGKLFVDGVYRGRVMEVRDEDLETCRHTDFKSGRIWYEVLATTLHGELEL